MTPRSQWSELITTLKFALNFSLLLGYVWIPRDFKLRDLALIIQEIQAWSFAFGFQDGFDSFE